ncbi:hypothetical protein [Aliiroseovarius sp.]|uniref:hypothetical protein n=1 Tax=Aliiroseovarius sp. TaxID=1872442 RepID=UPI003BA9D566
MDLHIALALVAATLLLVAIPGPNVALIVANTLARGFCAGRLPFWAQRWGLPCSCRWWCWG